MAGRQASDSFLGRFTDGRNWVDYFPGVANHFNVQIPAVSAYFQNPSSENASDFAISGSTSGEHNGLIAGLTSFPAQIRIYLQSLGTKSARDDLCAIWIGANDSTTQPLRGFALADQGADTRLIQDYLGHRNIQHTVKYTATNPTRFVFESTKTHPIDWSLCFFVGVGAIRLDGAYSNTLLSLAVARARRQLLANA
jgi:hypothetical protein